jgi:hypothetical protein
MVLFTTALKAQAPYLHGRLQALAQTLKELGY